jgi:hypothetical protein
MLEISSTLTSVCSEDGVAILDIDRNQIITLNSTGGFIWERLKRGDVPTQIIQDLACATDTDPRVVGEDLNAFLNQLAENGLLKR